MVMDGLVLFTIAVTLVKSSTSTIGDIGIISAADPTRAAEHVADHVTRCGDGYFKCDNERKCIPNNQLCNGLNNCGDMSDERWENCPVDASQSSNLHGQRPTMPTRPHSHRPQHSGSPSNACPLDLFRCHNGYKCVPKSYLCNGYDDCGDLSDEQLDYCWVGGTLNPRYTSKQRPTVSRRPHTRRPKRVTGSLRNTCGDGYFQCYNQRKCIPNIQLCNGLNNCGDMSDERWENCRVDASQSPDVHGLRPTMPPRPLTHGPQHSGSPSNACPLDLFRCHNGHKCVPKSYLCNGYDDCEDLSDEQLDYCWVGGTHSPRYTSKHRNTIPPQARHTDAHRSVQDERESDVVAEEDFLWRK